jgi:uncharacterized membrane protein
MLQSPLLLAAFLIALVVAVLQLEKYPPLSRLFHYLPAPFWCYFLPMLLATFGVLPEKSPVYSFLTTYVLSGCLILLLLNVNLPSILRVGPTALSALAVGIFGIGLGAVVSYGIFSPWLPPEMWKGIGSLSASWTGGSANMLAVKEGLQTPENVFAPVVIVDTVVTYAWMGTMIALAAFQDRWDLWVKADRSALTAVAQRLQSGEFGMRDSEEGSFNKKNLPPHSASRIPNPAHAVWLIGGSVGIGALCLRVGMALPSFGGVLNPAAWAFLMVTLIGIGLSLTPAAGLERYGASRWGYLCLYLLLAAMGSRANLRSILNAPLLVVMAVVWVAIHAGLLALYGYFRRVPMFFLAVSSQANIGGTASAPIVAGVYQPRLASLGLLLAIATNTIGTYIGYFIAQACHWVQR